MKTKAIITLSLLVVLYGCKKKNPTPTEPTPVDPVATCQTGKVQFVGTYSVYLETYTATAEVVFKNNLCPTKDANQYTIKGLAGVMNPALPSNEPKYLDQDGVLKSDENAKRIQDLYQGKTVTLDLMTAGNGKPYLVLTANTTHTLMLVKMP